MTVTFLNWRKNRIIGKKMESKTIPAVELPAITLGAELIVKPRRICPGTIMCFADQNHQTAGVHR
jgi:hypothetical protein